MIDESRRITYPFGGELGDAVFVPKCYKCGRYVKPDGSIKARYTGSVEEPNATCKKCGRTSMLFEGWF